MLTAAVCGDVFASPSSDAVLAAIRHCAVPLRANGYDGGRAGVLLIVKNYTGDRLNFGLAAEEAKAEGIPVQMVVVGDDCALPRTKGIAGRRGIAGTVLVHKIAGAAAEEGASLADVTRAASEAAGSVASIGLAAESCLHPTQQAATRRPIASGSVELGLGIHGEPGLQVIPAQGVNQLVDQMLGVITNSAADRNYLPLRPGDSVAVLVNNLGGGSGLEMSIASGHVLDALSKPRTV